jgi:S-adenosyl methyltransferase
MGVGAGGGPRAVDGGGREGVAVAGQFGWVPDGVDTQKANVARVYDYWLGGTHNFRADQDAARALIAVEPTVRDMARANRDFLGRAVRFLAASGIRQFLDIGSGIPTERNVHEVAQQAAPGVRVMYVDIDPVAIAHSKKILAGRDDTAVIQADLLDPERILSHPETRRMIDFSQPVGLLLVAVLHVIPDSAEPLRSVATLREALAPGSFLVICHATNESRPDVAAAAQKMYSQRVSAQSAIRPRAGIQQFFDGFDLVDPGLVYIPEWRPDSPEDVPEDPGRFWALVGVGRKP